MTVTNPLSLPSHGALRPGRPPAGPEPRALVSIVIPCFDAERYVAEAIESALAQTYPCIEVIAIDDASTDGTAEVLRRFGSRIRWEPLPENLGPSAARNRGIELARGEYVQFLDADDLLLPEKVAACVEAFDCDVDLVFADNAYFLDAQRASRRLSEDRLSARLLRWLRRRPMAWDPRRAAEYTLRREIGVAGPLHRTADLRRLGGFREDLWSHEDIELHFRLAIGGARMRKLEPVLVHCRHHGSPTRLRNRPDRFLVSLRALDGIQRLAHEAPTPSDAVSRALADTYANIARKLLWQGYRAEAERAFASARALAPVPVPTGFPLYNWVSRRVGLERLESIGVAACRYLGVSPAVPAAGQDNSGLSRHRGVPSTHRNA